LEPKNSVAGAGKLEVATRIRGGAPLVIAAIDFDDEARARRIEVSDEAEQRDLRSDDHAEAAPTSTP